MNHQEKENKLQDAASKVLFGLNGYSSKKNTTEGHELLRLSVEIAKSDAARLYHTQFINIENGYQALTESVYNALVAQGDKKMLVTGKKHYTGNELALEIMSQTKDGYEFVNRIVRLGLDLFLRDKIALPVFPDPAIEKGLKRIIELASAGLHHNYPHPDDMHKDKHDEFDKYVSELRSYYVPKMNERELWDKIKDIIVEKVTVAEDSGDSWAIGQEDATDKILEILPKHGPINNRLPELEEKAKKYDELERKIGECFSEDPKDSKADYMIVGELVTQHFGFL